MNDSVVGISQGIWPYINLVPITTHVQGMFGRVTWKVAVY